MRFFHDSILLRKDRPKTFRTAASWVRKISSSGDNRQQANDLKINGLVVWLLPIAYFFKELLLTLHAF